MIEIKLLIDGKTKEINIYCFVGSICLINNITVINRTVIEAGDNTNISFTVNGKVCVGNELTCL